MNWITTLLCMAIGLLAANLSLAHPGIGIVMDSKGTVFYTDLSHVWKITPDGTHTKSVSNVHTHELYLDQNDNLYGMHEWYEGEATDVWKHYTWCLDRNGTLERTSPVISGAIVNHKLVVDSFGNSYFSKPTGDNELLMQETSTEKIRQFSNHQFKDIRWLHIPATGESVYVVDMLSVLKVLPNGKVELLAENLKSYQSHVNSIADRHYIMGVWCDATANVYVAVFGERKVIRIRSDGTVQHYLEADKGWAPTGGVFAKDGSLWLLEYATNNKVRVRKITPSGTVEVFEK